MFSSASHINNWKQPWRWKRSVNDSIPVFSPPQGLNQKLEEENAKLNARLDKLEKIEKDQIK
jgi:hypothetical protein